MKMKSSSNVTNLLVGITLSSLLFTVTAFADTLAKSPWIGTKVGEKTPTVNIPKNLAKNLATFDELDFQVYTKQDWNNLHKSHSENILVHYPDGHTTTGIPDHIKELDYMWTFAPDNRIEQHPVRFGTVDAEWTAVVGEIKGTFTKPMFLADGTVIQPTGKSYKLPMATIGHWNKQGQMDEEYLFWDNAAFMKQIGVAK
jgi:hypothetical protein